MYRSNGLLSFLALCGILLIVACPVLAKPTAAGFDSGRALLVPADVQLVQSDRRFLSDDSDQAALFEEGQYEFDARDYEAARRVFLNLIKRYPGSRYAHKSQRFLGLMYSKGLIREPDHQQSSQAKSQIHSARPELQKTPQVSLLAPPAEVMPPPVERQLVVDRKRQSALLMLAGDRVFFAEQSSAIGSKARVALERQARWLRGQGNGVFLRVIGHADDGGDQYENHRLSLSRAEAVRQRLVEEGLSQDRIEIFALGRKEPVAICSSAGCAAQNRRVMLHVMRDREQHNVVYPSAWSKPTR